MAIPAMNLQPSGARLSFDGFELDEVDARLTCEGQAVPIAPRPFAVLCALARRPGHLVTKSDLLDDVWGHRFVTDRCSSRPSATCARRCRTTRNSRATSRRCRAAAIASSSRSKRTSAARRLADDDAGKPDHPTPAALTALCRRDAALADLIRMVAATLERQRLAPEH